MDANETWGRAHTIGVLVMLAFIVAVGFYAPAIGLTRAWYLVMLFLFLLIVIAGQGICGRLAGFMIDSRNKMTLSRFQLIAWTVLVLGAYLAVVLARIKGQGADALAVAMPQELWWLLGISTASMVGSPLILSEKKQKVVAPKEKKRTVDLLAAQVSPENQPAGKKAVGAIGAVVVNAKPAQARFADLFRGDETGNAHSLDLGKVQMLFFTIVILLAYGFVLAGSFDSLLGADASFPALDQSMVTLLGISHAGYLSHKAVPHSAGAGANEDEVEAPDPEP